jgi:hypothetical protein
MSAAVTVDNGVDATADRSAPKSPADKKPRRRHTPGGAGLGKDASREAQRLAAAILEVLAGARTPGQAAEALGVSLPRYFQLETRAMQGLVESCQARPRGPGHSAERELAALRRRYERLERELARQQTLVRLAQRTIGLAPPKEEARAKGTAAATKGGSRSSKRRRRPVVRALRAAEQLQRQSEEAPATAAEAAQAKENTV